MFESKINRGRANGYAPLDSGSKVPLSYLPPIQSTIDTGSFATTSSFNEYTASVTMSANIDTASFATTGSNVFIGEQTISTIQGTGSLYLKPDSADSRDFRIYNTVPSDIHLKGNAAYNFFGDDTNYLKIDDNNNEITLRANSTIILETGNGDIIFNPDSGVYINSANPDNGVVNLGYLNAALDNTTGSFVTTSSFNEYTASVTMSVSINTASFATTGSNTFIGNQTINGSLTILTPSAGIPNGVSNWNGQGGWNQGFYSNLFTSGGTGTGLTVDVAAGGGGYINIGDISINTPGSGYSNGDVITIDNENNLPGEFTISIEEGSGWTFDTSGSLSTHGDIIVSGSIYANNLDGLISSSTQITQFGFISSSTDLSSLNSYTQSLQNAIELTGSTVSFLGNIVVYGTQSVINSQNVEISDNILYLSPTASIDNDLGVVGHYNDGTYRHAGIFMDASDGHSWKVFKGLQTETTATVDTSGTGFTLADFKAGAFTGTSFNGQINSTNGVISGSAQITTFGFVSGSYLTSLSGAISSSSQLTSSFDVRYTLSGSVVSGTTPAGTISGSSQLTSSFDGRYTQTGSFNTLTASFNSFTSSAQSVTTGSNSFNGTQTITGSLIITTGSFVASQILANTASLYLTSGSNMYVQNNGVVEITGSLRVSGSTILNVPVLYVGTGSGFEGGEIDLAYAQSGSTTLTGSAIVFDVYGDKIRIFENGGTNRGGYFDISTLAAGVGTDLGKLTYFIEAYANVSYTLPGSYTEDVCRYSVVSTNLNLPTSWFNTSTYTFTPLRAGYWEIIASYDVYRNGEASLLIKKNGTSVAGAGAISSVVQQVTKIIYLNGSTDYINVYNSGVQANARTQSSSNAFFQARYIGS